MIRCSECKKSIINVIKYQEWLELINFISFLELQGDITVDTRDHMIDILMTFKEWACEDEHRMANALEEIAYKNLEEKESDLQAIAQFRKIAKKGLGEWEREEEENEENKE